MRRLLFSLPVAAFIVLAGSFGAALSSGRDPHQLAPTLIDAPVPAFALGGLAALGLSRETLAGQVTLVNFFASWCVPCRAEHPLLMRLSEQEHVPVYGIAYKDKPADTARFIAQLGDPYRGIDLVETGRTGIDFGVPGFPDHLVIDH